GGGQRPFVGGLFSTAAPCRSIRSSTVFGASGRCGGGRFTGTPRICCSFSGSFRAICTFCTRPSGCSHHQLANSPLFSVAPVTHEASPSPCLAHGRRGTSWPSRFAAH